MASGKNGYVKNKKGLGGMLASFKRSRLPGRLLKSPEQLKSMASAGKIVAEVLQEAEKMCQPGVMLRDIDRRAEEIIRSYGAEPAFKGYWPPTFPYAFPYTICASVNEELVHGAADNRKLAKGDIFSVDVGARLDGFFGDAARTFPVGEISEQAERILKVCRECLDAAEKKMIPGGKMSDVSLAIQQHAENSGYSIVRDFVGHGIGQGLHEDPQVPNFVAAHYRDVDFEEGVVLAIEPMINAGGWQVETLPDGWTVATRDKKLCAHFENTIAVTQNGPLVLTSLDAEEKTSNCF